MEIVVIGSTGLMPPDLVRDFPAVTLPAIILTALSVWACLDAKAIVARVMSIKPV